MLYLINIDSIKDLGFILKKHDQMWLKNWVKPLSIKKQ